jgi:ketosteroid isomerase-like protein
MNDNPQLQELLDKQALLELVYRYARAVDRSDGELLLSCYHPDAYQDLGYYKGGPTGLLAALQKSSMSPSFIGPLQHSITNALFEINGDVAHGECYCQMRSVPPGGGELQFGMCRYVDRFERRNGEWKIAHRVTVMEQRRAGQSLDGFTTGKRDRSDPSYRKV